MHDTLLSVTVQEVTDTNRMERDPSVESYIELHPVVTDCRSTEIASQSSDMTDSTTTPGDGVIPGKRKRVHRNTMEKILEVLKAPIIVPANQAPVDRDADKLFLLSLLPEFKKLNPRKKTNVKIKMLKLIDEAQEH